MRYVLWLLATLFSLVSHAQKHSSWKDVADKMRSIPQWESRSVVGLSQYINTNFHSDDERLSAIYYWLGNNIDYDLKRQERPQKYETISDVSINTLKNRKGVCEGFAGLMDTLCKLANIPVFTIYGFTRQQTRIDPLPHAWIAAKVRGDWYLFDPTFASGSLVNNKYVREFDTLWFKVEPEVMIETHMPYDHIWQFLNDVVGYKSFATANATNELYDKPFYYQDSIYHHLQLESKEKLRHELRRIHMNDFMHPVVKVRIDYLNEALRVSESNTQIETFNKATQAYNDAAALYNSYAQTRNQHRLDDQSAAQLSNLLAEAISELNRAASFLRQINNPPAEMGKHIRSLSQSIGQLRKQVNSEMSAIGNRR